MHIKRPGLKLAHVPKIFLNSLPLLHVKEFKYLGHEFYCLLKDDSDIKCQTRALYAHANCLIKNLHVTLITAQSMLNRSFLKATVLVLMVVTSDKISQKPHLICFR